MQKRDVATVVFVGAGASKAAFDESPLMAGYFSSVTEHALRAVARGAQDSDAVRTARALIMLEVHGLLRAGGPQAVVLAGHLWDRFRQESWWQHPKPRTDFVRLLHRYLIARRTYLKSKPTHLQDDDLERVFVALEKLKREDLLDRRFEKDAEFERSLFNFFASLYRRRAAAASGYSHLERLTRNCLRHSGMRSNILVVNLNYDAFMDHAVARVTRPQDSVSLYGGILDYELDQGGVQAIRRRPQDTHARVIKPHGSVTWWSSAGGQAAEYACTPFDGRFHIPQPDAACFFHRTKWYQPRRWIRPILVPPREKKRYPAPCQVAVRMMSEALEHTREVWIVGWSMPGTDEYLKNEIASAIVKRNEPVRWLRIIDHAQGEFNGLQEKASILFAPSQVDTYWRGLQTWRGWAAIE